MSLLFLLLLFVNHSLCEDCVCVDFWKCNDDSTLDDYTFLGIRMGCDGIFEVCCKVSRVKVACGQRKTENLVLGNNYETNFAEFPWMLGILKTNTFHCGASLIHPRVALTAAHCVHSPDNYKVRAGEWNWRHRKEPLKHQDRRVQKIVIHPRYDPRVLHNDIALMVLERPFQLTDNVGVVCLPAQNSAALSQECVLTGWGATSYKSTQPQAVLNKAILPIVSNNRCEKDLQRSVLGPMFKLHTSFICAGGNKKDACKGDGGSPLTCGVGDDEDRYEQFGIVSWGLACGANNAPGVYVNVASFVDWIDQQMSTLGLDARVYKYEK